MPLNQYPSGKPVPGVIGRTADESSRAWPAIVRAPEGSPNVVFIVLDDTGFGQRYDALVAACAYEHDLVLGHATGVRSRPTARSTSTSTSLAERAAHRHRRRRSRGCC
jgi:hypothetical protein